MSRDPVRLAMGGPAGVRLARALRASRKTEPEYDVDAGLDRFTAALGAAGMMAGAAAVHAAAAEAAKQAASGGAVAQPAAGATKAALGIKGTLSSILLMGAIGSAAIVGTSQVLRYSEPSRAPADGRMAAPPGSAALTTTLPTPAWTAPPAVGPPSGPSHDPSSVPSSTAVESAPRSLPGEAPSQGRGAVAGTPRPAAAAVDQAPVPGTDPSSTSRGAGPAASGSGSSRSPGPEKASTDLKPEMEQLALIRRTYDPNKALALAEEGHARFSRGLFWQERESVAITSLARLGRTPEARVRARRFIARHPESLYVEELRRMLGE